MKDSGHSVKSAGGRLQLNVHVPYRWLCMEWHDISDTARGCVVYTECTEMAADFQYIVSGCDSTVVLMSVCLEQSQCYRELNGVNSERDKGVKYLSSVQLLFHINY